MKIEVTQEDIDNGKAASCLKCPVALAIARHTEKKVYVCANGLVDRDPLLAPLDFDYLDYYLIYPINGILYTKIRDFDFGRKIVKPFSFTLSAECFMV